MTVLERLRSDTPLILDGALGSLMIARGLPPGTPPEKWVLDRPEELETAYRSYFKAGSNAVHACTFGANPIRLSPYGLAGKFEEINRAAVELARRVAPPETFIFGDIGPTGEYLPPVGQAVLEQWREGFQRQGRILAEVGVDAFHIETMIDVREATVALEALRQVAPDIPVLVSLTFDRKKRGFFTAFGDAPGTAFSTLVDAGAAAVGANCGISSPDMRDLAQELLAQLSVPLVLQPNAGTPQRKGDKVVYLQRAEEFAEDMTALVKDGVAVVGGCCGTDPTFIAALTANIRALSSGD